MWLIRFAMSRPITLMVVVVSVVLASFLAVSRMKIDIFPDLNLPVVYVVQPYGGMDPAQMEGYLVSQYEQHFLYISGIDHIESKSIQSAAVMKVYFQPGTNMADGMAQVMAQVERSRAYMPPGTVAPFVLRFDAGNVPVGYLVFSSPTRSVGEIQDLAFTRVRPVVSTIPGVSTPPPFGGNQRSIVIHLNPERLLAYHMSPEKVVQALTTGNIIMPSGIVRIGDKQPITHVNSVVENIRDLLALPIKAGAGPTVFLGDLGTVEDTTDIPTGYALVNGRRTVYIAIAKRADASTLSVVNRVKAAIPRMQDMLPNDIKVSFQFDQSIYVTEAMRGVLFEGGLGAILTGLVVLLFLKDIRSSLIVVLNIPFALLAAVVGLWACGQTINIMTLGGLALAVGILVDEATVAIENIHTHLSKGAPLYRGIFEACVEVATPRLLAMLSVCSVFMPSFFMTGSTQSLFVPLSLAVGFAMVASYLLSNTFVPVLSAWLLKEHPGGHEEHAPDLVDKLRDKYRDFVAHLLKFKWQIITAYAAIVAVVFIFVFPSLGREIFPAGNPTGFQLRIKAPTGTRIEETELIAQKVLKMVSDEVGQKNVEVTIGYVGTQPPSYAISNVYMWTSGPQEAVLLCSFNPEAKINMATLKERMRKLMAKYLPAVSYTFEAGDIVNQIMNFGAPTPIQVDINGPSFSRDQDYANRLYANMKKLPLLRDVVIAQPLDYPTTTINVDRQRAGQLGVTLRDIGKSLVAATYSSRFVQPIYWRDPSNGMAYQVQLEVPQSKMTSIKDIENVAVMRPGQPPAYVRDVATVTYDKMVGEYDRHNMQRQISITANLFGDDLGRAASQVDSAIKATGKAPKGVSVNVRGQVPSMRDTFSSLGGGLLFAVVVILLMLISYFQAVRLSIVVVSVVPAVVSGVVTMLALTHTTLNVQSFMGAIMSIGVGVANSILVVVFQENQRELGKSTDEAAVFGAAGRLRPVLMTSIAMIAGMIPMALGMGEGGDRTAPLGRAVIGGLTASTFTVLLVLPLIFSLIQQNVAVKAASLLPPEAEEEDEVYLAAEAT